MERHYIRIEPKTRIDIKYTYLIKTELENSKNMQKQTNHNGISLFIIYQWRKLNIATLQLSLFHLTICVSITNVASNDRTVPSYSRTESIILQMRLYLFRKEQCGWGTPSNAIIFATM